MNATILASVQSLLPIKAVATFEDPHSSAASQLVTVLSVSEEECQVETRRGNRYTLDSLCLNLHAYSA